MIRMRTAPSSVPPPMRRLEASPLPLPGRTGCGLRASPASVHSAADEATHVQTSTPASVLGAEGRTLAHVPRFVNRG
eukprot:4477414-Alexandrium_andersonii.AAC.1